MCESLALEPMANVYQYSERAFGKSNKYLEHHKQTPHLVKDNIKEHISYAVLSGFRFVSFFCESLDPYTLQNR